MQRRALLFAVALHVPPSADAEECIGGQDNKKRNDGAFLEGIAYWRKGLSDGESASDESHGNDKDVCDGEANGGVVALAVDEAVRDAADEKGAGGGDEAQKEGEEDHEGGEDGAEEGDVDLGEEGGGDAEEGEDEAEEAAAVGAGEVGGAGDKRGSGGEGAAMAEQKGADAKQSGGGGDLGCCTKGEDGVAGAEEEGPNEGCSSRTVFVMK